MCEVWCSLSRATTFPVTKTLITGYLFLYCCIHFHKYTSIQWKNWLHLYSYWNIYLHGRPTLITIMHNLQNNFDKYHTFSHYKTHSHKLRPGLRWCRSTKYAAYTRCYPEVPKMYQRKSRHEVVITTVPFIVVPLTVYATILMFLQLSEAVLEVLCQHLRHILQFSLISSTMSNLCPFKLTFNLGKQKKSHAANSGK